LIAKSNSRSTKEMCVNHGGSWATLASLVQLSDVHDGSGILIEIRSPRIGETVDLAGRTVLWNLREDPFG
jgi:hypothetical protein